MSIISQKIQYANIRPRGRDAKQPKLNICYSYHANLTAFLFFFKQNQRRAHRMHIYNRKKGPFLYPFAIPMRPYKNRQNKIFKAVRRLKTITRIVLRILYSASPPDCVGNQEFFYVALLNIIKKTHQMRHTIEFRRWHRGLHTPSVKSSLTKQIIPRLLHKFNIKNTGAIHHHVAPTNAWHVPPQNHTVHQPSPKILANDSYVAHAPIHA